MNSREIRTLSKLSRAAFSRKYNIPIRTLEDWDNGKNNPPVYVMELLERAVREDMNEKYTSVLSSKGDDEEHTERIERLIETMREAKDIAGVEFEALTKEQSDKAVGFAFIENLLAVQISTLEEYLSQICHRSK